MAQQLLCQPKLLTLATVFASAGCYSTYDLDCDQPEVTPSSITETPMLEDLEVPVAAFIEDLEEPRTAELFAGNPQGDIPEGQPPLEAPIEVELRLEYESEGELVTPDSNSVCGPPFLRLPVSITVTHEGDPLLTASGRGPVGWYADGHPRADMDAVFGPALWERLGIEPPNEERPIASMFVFYREDFAEGIGIELRYCQRSKPDCPGDFAHIVWER